jgi:hypothetical protein
VGNEGCVNKYCSYARKLTEQGGKVVALAARYTKV